MIISLGSKETEKIWNGIRVKKMPVEIQNVGRRKLRMLNNSQDIADLRIPPSNRLEKLTGKLNGFYSIRINKQWRIIFQWNNGNAKEVEINAVLNNFQLNKYRHLSKNPGLKCSVSEIEPPALSLPTCQEGHKMVYQAICANQFSRKY